LAEIVLSKQTFLEAIWNMRRLGVKSATNPLIAIVLISVILMLGWSLLSMAVNYLSIVRSEQQLYTFTGMISSDTHFYIEALSSSEFTYTAYVGLLRASNTPTTYYLCILNQTNSKPVENVDVEVSYGEDYQDVESVLVESDNVYILSQIARYTPLSADAEVHDVVLYKVNYTGLDLPLSIKIEVRGGQQPKLVLVLLVPYGQKYYEVGRLYVEWGG